MVLHQDDLFGITKITCFLCRGGEWAPQSGEPTPRVASQTTSSPPLFSGHRRCYKGG